ncbi:MAG: hypothetical protein ABII00_12180 [Elusimicrobiota bacterium]
MTAHPEKKLGLHNESPVVLALDTPVVRTRKGVKETAFKREFFIGKGSSLNEASGRSFTKTNLGELFTKNRKAFGSTVMPDSTEKVFVFLYPTRTYSEGLGGGLFSDMAPEDRGLIRKLRSKFKRRAECYHISLMDTGLFEGLQDYFESEHQQKKYHSQKKTRPAAPKGAFKKKPGLLGFDAKYLSGMKDIFVSCMTRPNRQDYIYLWTKTFGLNLVVRLVFVTKGVMSGQLPLARAVISTSWYQIQDAVFTVFGQTYMKFLGKMTGMLRLHNAYVGDFAFVYIQLCLFEFLNRLLLGPLGENPLVYTWTGVGLIFLNILQGMISGGPLIPAINKMRRVGLISHPVMMHLYQLTSLTMHFGLFASFGYQTFYAVLTGSVLVLSWTAYVFFSVFFKDPVVGKVEDPTLIAKIDRLAAGCYAAG